MTAREMYKSLGYKYIQSEMLIEYTQFDTCIAFWIYQREFYAACGNESKDIDVDEFKAIQQQMRELGWI